MQDYGYEFIKEIIAFSKEKRTTKKRKKANTYKATLGLLNEGLSLEEIAKKRELATTTIYSHLAKLYAENEDVKPMKFISKSDFRAIEKAKVALKNPEGLKVYFEHFEEAIDYGTIRLALAVLEKEETKVN
jgi:ATP-dependent DNA helicase RecQ